MAQKIILSQKGLKENNKKFQDELKVIDTFGNWDKPLQNSKAKQPRPRWVDTKEIAYTKSIKNQSKEYRFLSKEGSLPFNSFRNLSSKMAINEILWIYQKQSNRLDEAHKLGIKWWDNHEVNNSGTIGFAYGKTVDDYKLIDTLLHNMEHDPFSRRHILNLWQQTHINKQLLIGGLVPCAYLFSFNIEESYNYSDEEFKLHLESTSNFNVTPPIVREVDMNLKQRSSDRIVAGEINPFQYIALGLMICGHLTYKTGVKHILKSMKYDVDNMHYYDRHEEMVKEILSIDPEIIVNELSKEDEEFSLELSSNKNFFDYSFKDFIIKKPSIINLYSSLPVAQ